MTEVVAEGRLVRLYLLYHGVKDGLVQMLQDIGRGVGSSGCGHEPPWQPACGKTAAEHL